MFIGGRPTCGAASFFWWGGEGKRQKRQVKIFAYIDGV
jgi:hypothetical protein